MGITTMFHMSHAGVVPGAAGALPGAPPSMPGIGILPGLSGVSLGGGVGGGSGSSSTNIIGVGQHGLSATTSNLRQHSASSLSGTAEKGFSQYFLS